MAEDGDRVVGGDFSLLWGFGGGAEEGVDVEAGEGGDVGAGAFAGLGFGGDLVGGVSIQGPGAGAGAGAGMVGGVEGEGDLPFFTFAASTSFWSWRLALVRSSSGAWE